MLQDLKNYPKIVKFLRDAGELNPSDVLKVEFKEVFRRTGGYNKNIPTNILHIILKGNGFEYHIDCDTNYQNMSGKFIDID